MLVSKHVTLTYTNSRGLSMNLKMFSPYDLAKCEETLENDINSESLNYQHGEEFVSSSLGSRHIEITGKFNTVTQRREMKHEMERVFNPTLQGTLKYYNSSNRKTFTIGCMPEALPDISFQEKGVYFTINLVCHFPFWQGDSVIEHISTINKRGAFPLIIPETGFVFGYRADVLQTTFENTGDASAGATYILTAEGGTVVNPRVTHLESGRTTQLNYTMRDGDIIKVISMPSFATVRINDGINGMPYLEFDPDGNFFLLDFGANTIAYNADENATNLSVSVHYEPLYLGVE